MENIREHLNAKSIGVTVLILLAFRGAFSFLDLPVSIDPHQNGGFIIKESFGTIFETIYETAEAHCQKQDKHALRIDKYIESEGTGQRLQTFAVHHFDCFKAKD